MTESLDGPVVKEAEASVVSTFPASIGEFAPLVKRALKRAEALRGHAKVSPADVPQILDEALVELESSLEELQMAEEEMRTKNEQLLGAQEIAELERQRYQDLFDYAPDGYIVTDPEAVIHEANRAAAQLLGAA